MNEATPRAIPPPSTFSFALAAAAALLAVSPTAADAQSFASPPDSTGPLAGSLRDGRCSAGTDTLRSAWLRDDLAEFRRAAAIAGRATLDRGALHRLSKDRTAVVCAPADRPAWGAGDDPSRIRFGPLELTPLPVQSYSVFNSGYPRSVNDGALWAGRGISSSLRGGVRADWGAVSVALAPSVHYQQNRAFEVPDTDLAPLQPGTDGTSRHRYPWQPNIDWPLRFGYYPYATLRPGQSYVRVDAEGLAAGVSTENLWIGPATRYPLIMSNTAAGFPHAFAGTSGPVDVTIGRLGAQIFWGRLDESRFFDSAPTNDTRLINGLVVSFSPEGLPGLTVGGSSIYENTLPPRGLPSSEYFQALTFPISQEGGGSTAGNGLGSLFARWVLPESGFELYFEWGKEDFNADLLDFAKEPDHAQAWTWGLQKVWSGADTGWIKLTVELAHLQHSLAGVGLQQGFPGGRDVRRPVTWYVHHGVTQGHTQRGQLLGAYIGPGSTAQYLSLDWYRPWGRLGGFAERVRYDEDAYRAHLDQTRAIWDHDVELTLGARSTLSMDRLSLPGPLEDGLAPFDLELSASVSNRYDRHFIETNPTERDEKNWRGELSLIWQP